jgi:hypothetical protein
MSFYEEITSKLDVLAKLSKSLLPSQMSTSHLPRLSTADIDVNLPQTNILYGGQNLVIRGYDLEINVKRRAAFSSHKIRCREDFHSNIHIVWSISTCASPV